MSYGRLLKLASWIYTLWFVNHQSCDNCQVRCIRSVRATKTQLNISLNTSSVCPRPEFHELLPWQTWKGPENPCQSSTDGLKWEYYRFPANLTLLSSADNSVKSALLGDRPSMVYLVRLVCQKAFDWQEPAFHLMKKQKLCQVIPLSCGLQNRNLRLHTGQNKHKAEFATDFSLTTSPSRLYQTYVEWLWQTSLWHVRRCLFTALTVTQGSFVEPELWQVFAVSLMLICCGSKR